jgi:hypothetical protein
MFPRENEHFNSARAQHEAARNAHANGGAMQTGNAPKTVSGEVSTQLQEQAKGLEYLHQQVAQLYALVEPVLMPGAPAAPASDGAGRTSVSSGLAMQIRQHNDQLAAALHLIDDLIRRVAL